MSETSPQQVIDNDRSPDKSQERVIDAKKAAHMAYAANVIFDVIKVEDGALNMMKKWHKEGDSPIDTADKIAAKAEQRVLNRAIETGNFDEVNLNAKAAPKAIAHGSADYNRYTNVSAEMIASEKAYQIADIANGDQSVVDAMAPASPEDRAILMDTHADAVGVKYDKNVRLVENRLSRLQ